MHTKVAYTVIFHCNIAYKKLDYNHVPERMRSRFSVSMNIDIYPSKTRNHHRQFLQPNLVFCTFASSRNQTPRRFFPPHSSFVLHYEHRRAISAIVYATSLGWTRAAISVAISSALPPLTRGCAHVSPTSPITDSRRPASWHIPHSQQPCTAAAAPFRVGGPNAMNLPRQRAAICSFSFLVGLKRRRAQIRLPGVSRAREEALPPSEAFCFVLGVGCWWLDPRCGRCGRPRSVDASTLLWLNHIQLFLILRVLIWKWISWCRVTMRPDVGSPLLIQVVFSVIELKDGVVLFSKSRFTIGCFWVGCWIQLVFFCLIAECFWKRCV